MREFGWLWAICASVLAGALWQPSALAWSQHDSGGSSPCGLRWQINDIHYTIDLGGQDAGRGELVSGAVHDAFGVWQQVVCGLCAGAQGCPVQCVAHPLGIAFHDDGESTTPAAEVCLAKSEDGCGQKAPGGAAVRFVRNAANWPYGEMVLAVTVLTFDKATGEILAANVHVDDSGEQYCLGACKPGQFHLGNALTHEFGHLLGMDHSQDAAATLHATAAMGETSKMTLATDDRLGVCSAYAMTCSAATCPKPPVAADPARQVQAEQPTGCQAQHRAAPPGPMALLAALGVLGLARARRRRP